MAAGNRSLFELPRANLEDILTKVPLPSLLDCCAVSKSLLKLIRNDPEFARVHLAKSEPQLMIQSSCICLIDLDTDAASRVEVKPNFITPIDRFHLTHSCNGLVLLEHTDVLHNVHHCMISNPVIGEYTLLPEIVARLRTVECGFFYWPKTNHFEVLCTFYPVKVKSVSDASSSSSTALDLSSDSVSDSAMEPDLVSDHDTNSEGTDLDIGPEDQEPFLDSNLDYVYHSELDPVAKIFVKGSRSWESLGSLPFSPLTIYSPCHLEKTVHWICMDKTVSSLIVFFNFQTHEFGEISGPAHLTKTPENAYAELLMVVVGNRLTIIDCFTNPLRYSVWVMKEYGVQDSWSREFVVDTSGWLVHDRHSMLPITCKNNGELVMLSDHGFILFYDLNKKKGRVVNHPPLDLESMSLMHTPSFISLRDVMCGSRLEVVMLAPRLADPGLIPNNYLELSTADLTGSIAA
ncbi:F-box protein At3g07870-like [Bidens hawaiensis]|uniref:F-box protein At3g07870-like n=1 Tax=Bidens hawaiensis TaxID=980011 RepID=UPI00404AC487